MYTDINTALAIAKANIGLTDTTRDTELLALLIESTGNDGTTTYYRPYVIAAYVLPLWNALARGNGLISADGATWLKPADYEQVLSSLLTLQESADCGLEIEPCWRVDALRARLLCGCEAEKGAVVQPYLGAMVI